MYPQSKQDAQPCAQPWQNTGCDQSTAINLSAGSKAQQERWCQAKVYNIDTPTYQQWQQSQNTQCQSPIDIWFLVGIGAVPKQTKAKKKKTIRQSIGQGFGQFLCGWIAYQHAKFWQHGPPQQLMAYNFLWLYKGEKFKGTQQCLFSSREVFGRLGRFFDCSDALIFSELWALSPSSALPNG